MQSGNIKFLEPSGPLQACNGTALPFSISSSSSSSSSIIFIIFTVIITQN